MLRSQNTRIVNKLSRSLLTGGLILSFSLLGYIGLSVKQYSGMGGSSTMIKRQDAVKGTDKEEVLNEPHFVLKTNLRPPYPDGHKTLVVATGCYWGAEKGFWRLPGVYSTAVGYCGGFTKNPTYQQACSGDTGHSEAVLIVYDEKKIGYVDLLRQFWECHDPTQFMGQGGDQGTQYRSCVFPNNDVELKLTESSRDAYSKALGGKKIHTQISLMSEAGPFYFAHQEFQQYLARPGSRQYCSAQPQGVSLPAYETWKPEGVEGYEPKLSEAFWKAHGPKPHCTIKGPNEQIVLSSI